MKTSFKSTGILAILFALMALFTSTAKAQCNFVMSSNLGCPVIAQVDVYDFSTTPPPACNPVPCNSYMVPVPPGAVVPINCGTCPNVCNIRVTIVNINGMPIPPASADFGTTVFPGTPIVPIGPPCSTSGMTYIVFDPAGKTFKIHQ